MPEKRTIKEAQAAKRKGKSPSTQAGAFVHEAIEHVRKGKHGAKNAKQAIAIGLSEARRAGVAIPDKSKKKSTVKAHSGHIVARKASPARSKAAIKRLKKGPASSVSHAALSRHARKVAHKR